MEGVRPAAIVAVANATHWKNKIQEVRKTLTACWEEWNKEGQEVRVNEKQSQVIRLRKKIKVKKIFRKNRLDSFSSR